MSEITIQGSITVDKYSHLPIDIQERIRSLERDNAALKFALDAQADYQYKLRADRERLDWLLSHNGRNWFFRTLENGEWIASMGAVRGFIDAAMEKEAQP